MTPTSAAPPDTPLGGQAPSVNQCSCAAQNPSGPAGFDDGQVSSDTQTARAIVEDCNEFGRRYTDFRRAHQRLLLQTMATCRGLCAGDKAAGAALYKDRTDAVQALLLPFDLAMEPLSETIVRHEKLLDSLGKQLPVAEWAAGIAGLSPRFLAMIVGECAAGPGEFKSPAALWKRMGLAVIGGERQRRVTGAAALEHGYVARRRSLMWNIGSSILKQQVRKSEDGESYAIGDYGHVYLDRKAFEVARNEAASNADLAAKLAAVSLRNGEKPNPHNLEGKLSPAHIHNRAARYMEKRLLRELWKAWRAATRPARVIADVAEMQEEARKAA